MKKHELTDEGRMNLWMHDASNFFAQLLNETHEGEQKAYLKGMLAGLRMMQSRWLNRAFSAHDGQEHGARDD